MLDPLRILLLLAPIPVCAVLVRYLSSRSDELEGTLLGSLTARVSGVLATYLVLFLLATFTLDPSFYGLDLTNEARTWAFELTLPYTEEPQAPLSGSITLGNGARNALWVQGEIASPVGMRAAFQPGGVGVMSSREIYFTIPITENHRSLVAFGFNRVSETVMNLHVAHMETALSGRGDEHAGSLVLRRIWPWPRLLVVMLIPLAVVTVLSLIGPIVAELAGRLDFIPQRIRRIIGNVSVRLGGGTAAYLLISAGLVWVLDGELPQTMATQNHTALVECDGFAGTWFHHLYHPYDGPRRYFADYAGRMKIDCGSSDTGMTIFGTANKLFDPDYRYRDERSCYESIQPGEGGFEWRSVAAAVIDQQMLAIYRSVEADPSQGELGILLGTSGSPARKWLFRDFRQFDRQPVSVNSGEMILRRPDSPDLEPCDQLSNQRISTRGG